MSTSLYDFSLFMHPRHPPTLPGVGGLGVLALSNTFGLLFSEKQKAG